MAAILSAGVVASAPVQADDLLERVRAEERERIALIERITPSVVCIFDEAMSGGGSGVIIREDGTGLTNFHVIAGMLKTRRGLGGLSDGRRYPLEVLGVDPTGDLAMFRLSRTPHGNGGLLRTPHGSGGALRTPHGSGGPLRTPHGSAGPQQGDHFTPAPLGDSDDVRVGDEVLAAGNPFVLAEDYVPTITFGVVSGMHRYQQGAGRRSLVYTDCIQTDASINPGNSGGPLFDRAGRVIGINGRASFEERGRVNVGLAYAISINQIKRFIPGLEAGLLVEHGSLGATTTDLGYRHVVFEKMLDPSVASAAGIAVGDRLLEFAGQRIHSSNQFLSLLGAHPAGWPVELVFEHDGAQAIRTIHLERLPTGEEVPFPRDEAVTRRAAVEGAASATAPLASQPAAERAEVSDLVNRSMVKLHGGAIGREEGYGTGVIVSSEGWVVTPLTLLVEGANIRAVTYDGHIYSAETAYRDAYRQLALLKLARRAENVDTAAPVREQMASATFTPLAAGDASDVRSGEWILAVGNPFKVAGGEEPLSVMRGVVAGRRPLDATRRTGESLPYRGDVILFDVITSNPGAPGGALVDLQGRWLGLVGKEAWSRQTNTRLNYAYPIEEIHAFYEQARAGADVATRPASIDAPPGYHGIRLSMIGYRKRLPFVQSVEAGSPAALAGVRPDDMIVSANGVAIPRVRVFDELCEDLHAGDELVLVIRRGEQLISLRLTLTESPMK